MVRATTGKAGGTAGGGSWLMILGAAAGLVDALVQFFQPDNGIHGSWGALAVVVLTALILGGSLLVGFGLALRRGWRGLLMLLLLCGIVGAGVCAWLLETEGLLALMALALLGWAIRLGTKRRPVRPALHLGPTAAP